MKKRTVQLLCLLLALLTVCIAAASCSGEKNPVKNPIESSEPATDEPGDNADVDYRSYLPTGDYENEECWIFMPNLSQSEWFVEDSAENKTELEEAVIARNTAVEDRLNLVLMFAVEPTHEVSKYTQVCMNSGSYDYDIIYAYSWFGLESQEAFENLYDYSQYLNLENPYWASDLNEQSTINGRLYGAYGYYAMSMVGSSEVVFYNGTIAKNYLEVDDLFYEDVENNNWTLETMQEYMQMNSMQGDSDETWSFSDNYGLAYNLWSGRAFLWGAGLKLAEYQDGEIELLMRRPRNSDVFDKVYDFLKADTCYYRDNTADYSVAYDSDTNLFVQERALFIATTMSKAPTLSQNMKSYGVLPMPKLDSTQADYITPMSGVSYVALFKGGDNNKMAAKVLEAMCILSYCDNLPIYYEKQLKFQYQTDARAAAMLDFIRSKTSVDFMEIFSAHFEYLANIPFELIRDGDDNYEGTMSGKVDSLNKKQEDFLKLYFPQDAA